MSFKNRDGSWNWNRIVAITGVLASLAIVLDSAIWKEMISPWASMPADFREFKIKQEAHNVKVEVQLQQINKMLRINSLYDAYTTNRHMAMKDDQ